QRERVELLVGHPEGLVEPYAQPLGALAPAARGLLVSATRLQVGHREQRRVAVALHLRQRDRTVRGPSVGEADRVGRVLPALVEQTAVGRALVLDEAVAVAVAVLDDPARCGLG